MLEDIPGFPVHTAAAPIMPDHLYLLDEGLLDPDLPDGFPDLLPDDGPLEVDEVLSFAASF